MRLPHTQSGARNDRGMDSCFRRNDRGRKKIQKEIQKMDSRFHGNDIGVDRGSESFILFFQFYNVL